jgi:two-component system, cell cycle response regulator DivK
MNLSQWNVLVIEDEADSMELVQGILEYHGIETWPAPSGEEALDILQTRTPTLIIVDLSLPGIDGWGLIKEFQQWHKLDRVPRIAVTAYHTAEVARQAIEAGFDAYFSKPLDATSFVRELATIAAEY